jgi:tetratricopeptide (TPR) repeat protein
VREEAFNSAIDAYKRAIKLSPGYFEPNYNIGALYVNKAATINDQANKLPLDADAEYKKLKAEADGYLEKATPYLETAAELMPDDINTLYSLKQIYSRLNKTEKLKAISDKINSLQKK